MNAAQFKAAGYQLIDISADYMDKIRTRQPLANVEPGYIRKFIPMTPPEQPEKWEDIIEDLEPAIFQGMTHWNHPNFYAYFASGNSWPSILADILVNAFAGSSSTWASCPAATELEMIVLDWLAKMLHMPSFFYSKFSNPKSQGGGAIESSASEAIYLALICAREYAVQKLAKRFPGKDRCLFRDMLVCYCNNQSHSSVEKGAIMALCKLRLLEPNDEGVITAKTLHEAILEDKAKGLVPFFYNGILGSTTLTVFDDLLQVGPICRYHDVWLHVDSAYAGASFCCSEILYLTRGLEYAWSLNTNSNKWMLVNFDCSILWVKYKHLLVGCMSGYNSSLYNTPVQEFRFWGIPNTRRFRALKLWAVMRNYGIKGIRKYIRNHCTLAKRLENHIRRENETFTIVGEPRVGLTCFGFKGELEEANKLTHRLLETLNATHEIHMVPGSFKGKFIIRMAVCYEHAADSDIDFAWKLIKQHGDQIKQIYKMELELKALEEKYEKEKEKGKVPEPFPKMASVVLQKLKSYYAERKVDEAAKQTSTIYGSTSFGQITDASRIANFEKMVQENQESRRRISADFSDQEEQPDEKPAKSKQTGKSSKAK